MHLGIPRLRNGGLGETHLAADRADLLANTFARAGYRGVNCPATQRPAGRAVAAALAAGATAEQASGKAAGINAVAGTLGWKGCGIQAW